MYDILISPMSNTGDSITYSQAGDDYSIKDPVNKLSQLAGVETAKNLTDFGFKEVPETRGESAYVVKVGDIYIASVTECLGTKNLIADEARKLTGKTYYDVIAQDTVATFINDLATCGAKPLSVHAYWAIEDNSFLQDAKRTKDFIEGWKNACNLAGASWGGGETATLKEIMRPDTINLAGSAVGIINNEKRLLLETKLKSGDRILLIKSNGVNANGISLCRAIAKMLPGGYATKLPDGTTYGQALLKPSNIYAELVQAFLDANLDLHYITHITGHGLRKIMRAKTNFKYTIEKVFEVPEIFKFIQSNANLSDYQMYETFNMGQDYAIFLPESDVAKAQEIVSQNGFESLDSGFIEEDERKVIIKPKDIVFEGNTLNLR
jgi:phosphoribosylformylglycinamidine cyclo-ligase